MQNLVRMILFLLSSNFQNIYCRQGTFYVDFILPGVMTNLSDNTVRIIEQIMQKCLISIYEVENLLTGHINAIENMAMEHLNGPLSEFNSKLNTGNCLLEPAQLIEMNNLLPRSKILLNQCKDVLTGLIEGLQQEKTDLNEAVKGYIKDIYELPNTCQLHNFAFFTNFICYRERLTELADVIGVQVNRINGILLDTRQLAKSGTSAATKCARDIVNKTISDLTATLQYC